jgi:hypothetical protein
LWTYAAWAFVLAINMAVPLLFSGSVTEQHGKLGMGVALLSFLVCGCYLCAYHRKLALALLVGGVLVALTQLFPILQILAGLIGMAVGQSLGQTSSGADEATPHLRSEVGGFVVTLVTGGILIGAAACSGMAILWLTSRLGANRSKNAPGTLQ